ncbi:unnamed protein product [Aphis gossypii]|uniref:Secreted protein n=1 Tax=Aphis gossypii TaxID=80765 RepID=A0A9P0J250_APHGO|nr:unnamed protein product [Aphis gossypii]
MMITLGRPIILLSLLSCSRISVQRVCICKYFILTPYGASRETVKINEEKKCHCAYNITFSCIRRIFFFSVRATPFTIPFCKTRNYSRHRNLLHRCKSRLFSLTHTHTQTHTLHTYYIDFFLLFCDYDDNNKS